MERTVSESARGDRQERTHRDAEREGGDGQVDDDRPALTALHRSVGNQAVKKLHERGELQAKLAVSQPTDRSEREAERVAEAVMSTSAAETSEAETAEIQRENDGSGGTTVDGETERQVRSVRGGGSPLPDSTRSFFEGRFGQDFSDVRVHTGQEADEAARSINAEAFTIGSDIAFARGNYQPGTRRGKELLAHELTHVRQQGGRSRRVDRQEADSENAQESQQEDLTGLYTGEGVTLQLNQAGSELYGELQVRQEGEDVSHVETDRYRVEGNVGGQREEIFLEIEPFGEAFGGSGYLTHTSLDTYILETDGLELDSPFLLGREDSQANTFTPDVDEQTGIESAASAHERTPLTGRERSRLDSLVDRVSDRIERYAEGDERVPAELNSLIVEELSYWRDLGTEDTNFRGPHAEEERPAVTSDSDQWIYVREYLKRQIASRTIGEGDERMSQWSKLERIMHEYPDSTAEMAEMLDVRVVENFAIQGSSTNHRYDWAWMQTGASGGAIIEGGGGTGIIVIRKKSEEGVEWTRRYVIAYGEVGASAGVSVEGEAPANMKFSERKGFSTHQDWTPNDFAGMFLLGKLEGPKVQAKAGVGASGKTGGGQWIQFYGPAGEAVAVPVGNTELEAKVEAGGSIVSAGVGGGYMQPTESDDATATGESEATDIRDAEDAQVESQAHFGVDESELAVPEELSSTFARYKALLENGSEIRIIGHASYTYSGPEDIMQYNEDLSESRAQEIGGHMSDVLELGTDPDVEGWGALLHKHELLYEAANRLFDGYSPPEPDPILSEADARSEVESIRSYIDVWGPDDFELEQEEDPAYRRVDILVEGELAFSLDLS